MTPEEIAQTMREADEKAAEIVSPMRYAPGYAVSEAVLNEGKHRIRKRLEIKRKKREEAR